MFYIYDGIKTADIIIDEKYTKEAAYSQLYRAIGDLRQDIAMTTGSIDYNIVSALFVDNAILQAQRLSCADENKTPQFKNSGKGIIIGSIEHSEIIKELIEAGQLPESGSIEGKWEAFLIKEVDGSLVIAGSDIRGTIYGIYHLSEKIGVSPWYYFSDVPVIVKDKIAPDFSVPYIDKGPDVKYRGIFINDEERLIDWAKLKFPTENGTPDVNLYRHIFELLLRLKANTLWPAMHEGTTAFNMAKDEEGVPVNAKEASHYGIIMASSHCEMMLRCNVSEWSEFKEAHKAEYTWQDDGSFDYTQNKEAILGYWKERLETNKGFESILALGIRGVHDGDAECDNLQLYNNSKVLMMADVIKEQRALIKEVYGSERAMPQVFIPYKGMAEIYNDGLKDYIPEDVMLMWAEDNYGNLRQTPTKAEAARKGGCGVYYHSSYWSWFSPKSYLWLNSTQLFYMAHQMQRAFDTGARAYWILNVGDIKPGDMVTELFLKMAWDINNKDNIKDKYLTSHAMRDFGADMETAEKIASVATEFYRLSGIKKAEFFGHANPSDVNNPYFSENMIYPFSTVSEGDEGMRLIDKCKRLASSAEEIYNTIPPSYRDAFYQQLYYHVLSYLDVAEEYVYLWKNNEAAAAGSHQSALFYAELSKKARERVRLRQKDFHAIKHNKWDMVINYDHPVSYYNMNEGVLLAHDDMYKFAPPQKALGARAERATLHFDSNAQNESYIDLFSKGTDEEEWSLKAPLWVLLSKKEGRTLLEERVIISIDFNLLNTTSYGEIEVFNNDKKIASIPIVAKVNTIPLEHCSFIEANGRVVILSEHYTENIKGSDNTCWTLFENAGKLNGAMSALPFYAPRAELHQIKASARLRYRVYFTSSGTFKGTLYRTPSLNEGANDDGTLRTCNAAIGIDNSDPVMLTGTSSTGEKWKDLIMHMVEPVPFLVTIPQSGWHDIYIYRVDSGIIFDRIEIETVTGSIPYSLSGCEESPNNISYAPRKVSQLP